jgi:hypothetical protein
LGFHREVGRRSRSIGYGTKIGILGDWANGKIEAREERTEDRFFLRKEKREQEL